MKKRTLLIAGLLLAAAVVSCGEAAPSEPASTDSKEQQSSEALSSAEETEALTEPETEQTDWRSDVVYTVYPEPDIPSSLDLTGKTFRIAYSTGKVSLVSEGLDGEIINDTIYARNLQVQEHFGITLDMEYNSHWDGILRDVVASGLPDYDLVYTQGDAMINDVTLGYGLDFVGLPYVDFTKGYWFPDLLENFSCYDRIFLAPSDIDPTLLGLVNVTFFNKRILTENDLENPYQLVYDNNWTLENFLGMVRKISKDLNGDGIMDEHDLYGTGNFGGRVAGAFTALAFGSGLKITQRNEDGSLSFAMDGEKMQLMIDQIATVLKDESVSIDLHAYLRRMGLDDRLHDRTLFATGHELFLLASLDCIQGSFRDMEDDFGVAPIPKYDSEQPVYHHRANPLTSLFAIPATIDDPEKTGAVFTYMTWLSNQTLLPAYYEITLKQKRTRDEDSAYMLDLIHNTISFDFGDLWTSMSIYIQQSFDAGSYERTVGASMKKLTKSLNKLQDKIKNLD